MNLSNAKQKAETPQKKPLGIGASAPDIPFDPANGEAATLSEGGRQPVVLLFSENDWNPARAEGITALTNALLETLAPKQRDTSEALTLHGVEQSGTDYVLRFEAQETVRLQVHELDSRGETARAFGVAGQQALFVLDGAGTVRWCHLLPSGTLPEVTSILAALREIQPNSALPGTSPSSSPASLSLQTTRREFVVAAFAGALALTLSGANAEAKPAAPPMAKNLPAPTGAETIPVRLTINGKKHSLALDPRTTLLDALREHLHLTGSKKGCDHGQCGACTVHINGQRVLSCLSLAIQQEGTRIVTIEGLAHGETLHPVQAAFIEHDGYQCGYCTSGQIMSAVALLREGRADSDAEIREGMSGNLCRCAAYPHIVAAIKAARDSKQRV